MRAGQHKLLLPLGEQPVLAHVLRAVLASRARPVVLVLGYQAQRIKEQLALSHPDLIAVENPAYQEGMSTSLHAGLHALEPYPVEGACIVLGDQPLLSASILDTLIAEKRTTGKRIIAPLYEGRRGNPVLFDASLFPELLCVRGDEGGRQVIARHADEVATIEAGTIETATDVDTWEAYQQVVTLWNTNDRES
ncbi:hypothetical protein KTH_14490 [Thermosporothrix hazakensis]|jgi:molybdenum cofactor cytidylyltransferase|nr:hypothetical protein KTC_31440 [Thermosporothrix sp. COM3]GCE46580.1 hypothetical protein KTH_14490 [Thermosporothrix hazakensis]